MDILELKDVKSVPDIVHEYSARVKNESIPLVIDNGNLYFITINKNNIDTSISLTVICNKLSNLI